MADARLDMEIRLTGTDKAARGLDDVANASKRAKAASYDARQAHEDWVKGYRNEVFSEIGEKIKRVSHISRENTSNLKWMGEGFKTAGREAISAGGAMKQLRGSTYGAYTAQLALTQLMRGDFLGAAQNAALSIRTLHMSMSAGVWAAYGAAAIAAIAGVIAILEKAKEKKRQLEESRHVQWGAMLELNYSRSRRENPYSGKIKGMSDSGLAKELVDAEAAYANVKSRTEAEMALLGKAPDKKTRETAEKNLADLGRSEQEAWGRIQAVEDEQARRKNEKKVKTQKGVDKRQADLEKRLAEEDRQRDVWRQAVRQERDLARERELSGISDPVERMRRQQGFLRTDRSRLNPGESADDKLRAVDLDRQILQLEQQITAEKERQNTIRDKEKESLRIRMEEYRLSKMTNEDQLAYVKKKIASLRASTNDPSTAQKGQMLDLMKQRDSIQAAIDKEGGADPATAKDHIKEERYLGGSFGIDVPDGYKIKKRSKYRSLAGGRATQWMKQSTARKMSAIGGGFVTTDMGRSPMETDGVLKGIDRTNKLLEDLKERLA